MQWSLGGFHVLTELKIENGKLEVGHSRTRTGIQETIQVFPARGGGGVHVSHPPPRERAWGGVAIWRQTSHMVERRRRRRMMMVGEWPHVAWLVTLMVLMVMAGGRLAGAMEVPLDLPQPPTITYQSPKDYIIDPRENIVIHCEAKGKPHPR
ncbi:uncharacterized protein LOC144192255 [Stigmatopora nigra]